MGIESVTNRLRSERRDVTVQTSISAGDADTLDEVVQFFNDNGVQTNRSGVLRAFLLDSLEAFKEVNQEGSQEGITIPKGTSGAGGTGGRGTTWGTT
jgi:hypothetical protein